MSKYVFIKLSLAILLSFGSLYSYAEELSQKTDEFICLSILDQSDPPPAYLEQVENRNLNCPELINFTTSTLSSLDGALIVDFAYDALGIECKTGYTNNNDSSRCEKKVAYHATPVPDPFTCKSGYEINEDSTGCIPIKTNTLEQDEKPEAITSENEGKSSSNIALIIALLSLVLLIILVVLQLRSISGSGSTDSDKKPKNKSNRDQSDDLQTLRKELSALMSSMNDLNQTFMTLKSNLDQKDKEIARYKSGYDATIYKNFLLRFTRVDKVIKEYISENKIDMNGLEDIQIQMDDALAECEVEVFSPEIGADFKATRGLADKPKTIETSDQAKDGMIAEIIEPGYRRSLPNDDYQIIVEAKVAIHVFKK